MKDSGIAWIGEIPKNWNCFKTKYLFNVMAGATPQTDKKEYWDGKYIWITPSDFKTEDMYVDSGRRNISELGLSSCASYLLPSNSIVFSKRAPIGLVVLTKLPLCTNQGCLGCVPKNGMNTMYYYYTMSVFTEQYELLGSGTTFKEISASNFCNFVLPCPSLPEQQAIANFLNDKCSEIDELISLQEKMIDELKSYKQSVITEVVTKGLDRNVKMKDSGVDWIGEIPTHWEIHPLKFLFNRRSHKNNPVETTERLSLSIDKGVTLYSEKTTNLDRFKDDFTQYQLAHPNDIVLNCMNMIVGAVGISNYFGCVSPVYYVIYTERKDVNPEFYSYLLNTPTIRSVYYSYGKGIYAIDRGEGRINTCRLKVSYEDLGRFNIPLPPFEEQCEIMTFINKKIDEIDLLVSVKQKKIEELKEYKKSLIYEYVTGKKQVI